MTQVRVRDFEAGDETAFRALNEEWIRQWFAIESSDLSTLGDPWGKVIGRGGRILMALADEERVGCCALIPIANGEYEVAKMAVTPALRGAGVGRRVLEAAVQAARQMGATRLYLETNRLLAPAIALYERVGFQHLPQFVSPYVRADVAMEMIL